MNRTSIIGMDLALNHGGLVELDQDGAMPWYEYTNTKATFVKSDGKRITPKDAGDKQRYHLQRLLWWHDYLDDVLQNRIPTHVGIEDYAFSAQSNSAYQIGELGGMARMLTAKLGNTNLRLHDPVSVKMYIAHDGAATPDEVSVAVLQRWPVLKNTWARLNKEALLDLCVAYGIARMVLDEHMLRTGQIKVSDFHAKEVQVWNRATKANPNNILSREWLTA